MMKTGEVDEEPEPEFAESEPELCEDKKVQESKKLQERDTSKEAILDSVNNKIVPELEWVAEFGKDAGLYGLAELCEEYANTLRNTKIEESKDCEEEPVKEGFSKQSFNEVFTKYYKDTISKTESFETIKVLKNDKAIKVEGKLNLTNGNSKDITLTLNKVQEGTSFTKYELHESGLLKESKSSVAKLMTRTNDNVIKCCYITK